MKFTETLSTHLTPEWRTQYMNYEVLKAMLIQAVDGIPAMENLRRSYYINVDQDFFYELEKELQKVNTFFAEKLAEIRRKLAALQEEINVYFTNTMGFLRRSAINVVTDRTRQKLKKVRIKQLKLAYSEMYLNLVLLQNYQNLNYTGFRKILKKHDKVSCTIILSNFLKYSCHLYLYL